MLTGQYTVAYKTKNFISVLNIILKYFYKNEMLKLCFCTL